MLVKRESSPFPSTFPLIIVHGPDLLIRSIWEKKYGKNAKHVLKARKEEEEQQKEKERIKRFGPSDAGWGGGRGGRGGMGGRGGAVGARGGRGGFSGPSGREQSSRPAPGFAPSPAAASSKPPAAGGAGGAGAAHLHPSWEAARLRKAKEAAQASAPKATKITFD